MHENEIAKIIVNTCFKIHKKLGPGLLESVYETVLCYELRKLGLFVERQKEIGLIYDDIKMEIGFRADLIVEHKVIVELKSVQAMHPVFFKTLLTYLRLTEKKLGLLINFNEVLIKDGIKRVANGL
ncbi:MAG: GxxExxY protein [Chitinophagales bacterium]